MIDQVVWSEEMFLLREEILPELEKTKPAYSELVRAFIEHNGDVEATASEAGLTQRQLTRRLRETVFPAVQKMARRLGYDDLVQH